MLITKQPKKANSNIRYSLGNNNSIINNNPGKPIKKNKKVKEKLNTNLSQLYINLNNHTKQNASLANLMIGRPHSSLVASDVSGSLSKSKEKDINIFCKDRIKPKKDASKRNSLAVGDTLNRNRKANGCSNSFNKWNNRSVQQDSNNLKIMMAQNRKKYNLSCGEMIESKSKTKQFCMKGKKKSGQVERSILKGQSKKKLSKKPEIENKKFKPAHLHKSKGSTANINQTQNLGKTKKKEKQNKPKQRSKSKNKKNVKSTKMFILSKGDTKELRQNEQQYPINKYFDIKQKPKKSLNIKVGLDYNFLGNIVSMSSGALYDQSSGSAEKNHHLNNFLLLDNKIYEKEPSDTINLEQIRYYEENSPIKKSEQINHLIPNRARSEIKVQLQQQYPYLNSQQLKFLSCVVFIQRKWRQYMVKVELKRAKEIVTDYVIDESQKSKEQMPRKEKSWFETDIEKTNIIAKTKISSFQSEQNKETVSKNRLIQLISSHQVQSRKNSSNKEVIIYSNDPSSYQLRSNIDGNQNDLTDRKPYTQKSQVQVNYSWKVSKQVFPEICYLQYRRNTLKDQLTKTIKIMGEDKKMKKMTQSEYEEKKGTIIQQYEKEISSLKKTKYDIKKGYLKYIDCLNHIKDSRQTDIQERLGSKYGIRKVSSQSNFLSNLYEKIFKFDGCISQWSGASQSVEILTKKILIRKQYYKKDGNRRSLSDVRSAGRNSFDVIKSTRQHLNYTLALVDKTDREALVENTAKLGEIQDIFEAESKHIKQFKLSKESWKIESQANIQYPENYDNYNYENKKQLLKQESTNNQAHFNENQQKRMSQSQQVQIGAEKEQATKQKLAFNLHLNRLTNSINLFHSQDQELLKKVQNEVIWHLTKELEADIHEINPVLVDIILINQPEVSFYDKVEVDDEDEAIEINNYQNNRQWYQIEQNSPAMRNLHHQLQGMTSPRENQFHFRNPYIPETEPEKAFEYVSGLIYFITKKKWLSEILYNVNNSETFSPLSYLKFLRDFEIPEEEEYVPIISNEKFIEWENFYSSQRKISNFFGSSEEIQVLKQSETIFHRCLFQVFLSQLQKHRAYGQRGRPFPWESKYSYSTIRQVTINEIDEVFSRCLRKVQQYLIYKCGLISEKLILSNEQQLQRAHQQNEDRIIEMLEQDLVESNHQWYEIEQHSLEIKLELTFLIEEVIFNEVLEAVRMLDL